MFSSWHQTTHSIPLSALCQDYMLVGQGHEMHMLKCLKNVNSNKQSVMQQQNIFWQGSLAFIMNMIHKETAHISRQELHQVLINIFRRCKACLQGEVTTSRLNKREEQTLANAGFPYNNNSINSFCVQGHNTKYHWYFRIEFSPLLVKNLLTTVLNVSSC